MRHRLLPLAIAALLAGMGAAAPGPPAGTPPAPTGSEAAKELVEHERVRSAVDGINDDLAAGRLDPLLAVDKLAALGPAVVPFMEAEFGVPQAPFYPFGCMVLGKVRSPESIEALRRAVKATDADTTPLAPKKKIWALYGLALGGEADVVDLLDEGRLKIATIEFFDRMTGLETLAMLTQPQSLPKVYAHLDKYSAPPGDPREIVASLNALGRLAERSALPRIVPFLKSDQPVVRAAAARALGDLGDPAAAGPLFDALEDPDKEVRFDIAGAIEDLKPANRIPAILARLDVETAPFVRAALYRTLAAVAGERALPAFREHWGRPAAIDRMWIADSVGRVGSTKGLNFLRAAVHDEDDSVAIRAVEAIAEIGGPGAVDTLLATIGEPRWPIAQTAIERLVALGERRAAPRIVSRLLRDYLSTPLTEPSRWTDAFLMGDAIVDLRYTDPIPSLREALADQPDATVHGYLDLLIRRLAAIQENKDDVPKWSALTGSSEQGLRRLAYSELGEIGGEEAAKALSAAFESAKADDALEILRALGSTRSPAAEPTLARVLLDDAWDTRDREGARSMAAWAARKMGGRGMAEALRKSAARRDGTDFDVLVYLAELTGKDALPVLRSTRVLRLRHFDMKRGLEQNRIDWMIRELEAGRSIKALDVPPEEIDLEY